MTPTGIRSVRLLTTAASALALVVTLLPGGARAQDPPPDTVGIVKTDEDPTNAEIAVRLSEATALPDTSTVLLGRDDEFADSLASGVLQSTSPLLLTPSSGPLPDRVRAELGRLDPDRVILLGGDAALTPAVADELAGLGYAVERRAGASRFETATAVARTDAATADTAILARAFPAQGSTDPTQAFADALAAGGMAAEFGWPVLLTQTEVLTGSTRAYLAESAIRQVKIMGGTAAVSAAVEAELVAMGIAVERIAGASRADTAIEVAKTLGADSAAEAAHVLLVQGQEADAWAGGFAAAARSALLDAPIVLAAETQLPPETRAWLEGGAPGTAAFAQQGEGPVLTCVVVPSLCEQARVAMGLPPADPALPDPDLVSVGADGLAAGGRNAAVAAAGSVVAFVSGGIVVSGVADGEDHVYLARLGADGVTDVELVDVRPDGTPAARGVGVFSGVTDLSTDGQFVAFQSSDGELDSTGVTTTLRGAYVRDVQSGTTRLVSVDQQGQPITPLSIVIDDDASVAVYRGQLSEGFAILHHDLSTGEVQPVLLPDGSVFVDGSGVGTPAVSGDGGTIAFYTDLPLIAEDTNEATDTYVYEVATGLLERVSVASDGSQAATTEFNDDGRLGISGDGSRVVFVSSASNLAPGDDPSFQGRDVFLHDRTTGSTTLLSRRADGTAADNGASAPAITADGRYAVFASPPPDLTGSGTTGCGVYRVDLANGGLVRLDATASTNNCPSQIAVADGGAVTADIFGAFTSSDTNGRPDVYRWPA